MSDFRSKLREKNAKASAKTNIENIQDNGLGGLFSDEMGKQDINMAQNARESLSDASRIDSKDVNVELPETGEKMPKNENNALSDKTKQIKPKKNEEFAENVEKKEITNSVKSVESVGSVKNVNDANQDIVQKGIKNASKSEESCSSNQEKGTSSKFEEFVRKSNLLIEGKELPVEEESDSIEQEEKDTQKTQKKEISKKEASKKDNNSPKESTKIIEGDGRKPLTDVKCSNEERMPTTSWNCMIDPELDIRFRYEVQVRETTIIELINRILLQEREWEREHPEFITKEYVLENIRKSRNKKTEGRVALSLGLLPESWEYLKSSSKRRGMKMNAFVEFLLETYC